MSERLGRRGRQVLTMPDGGAHLRDAVEGPPCMLTSWQRVSERRATQDDGRQVQDKFYSSSSSWGVYSSNERP